MSLIHEALARAQEEAARREALARGGTLPAQAPPPRVRFLHREWLLGAAGLAVVALAVVGLVALLPGGGSPPPPMPVPAPPAASPGVALGEPPASPLPDPAPPSIPAGAPASLAPTTAPVAGAVERRSSPAEPAAAPASEAAPAEPHLELQGIVWSAESPSAVINGTVLSPGENLGAFTLLRVEPRSVVLGDGEREIELVLAPPAI